MSTKVLVVTVVMFIAQMSAAKTVSNCRGQAGGQQAKEQRAELKLAEVLAKKTEGEQGSGVVRESGAKRNNK